jgi:hypothetical protein
MNDILEREVTEAFLEAAPSREPDRLYDSILSATSSVRPRPRWFAIMKEPPMRRASRVVVGSPTVRTAALLTATLLVALLGAGALVVGAQSPTPVPPEGASPQPPVAFTGQLECGPAVRSGSESRTSIDDGEGSWSVLEERGFAWQQTVEVSDPRLSGVQYFSAEGDTYTRSGSTGLEQRVVGWATVRIENDGGAWQGSMVDLGRPGEAANQGGTYVLAGEGGYEGLTAVYEIVGEPSACVFDIEGITFAGEITAAEPFLTE